MKSTEESLEEALKHANLAIEQDQSYRIDEAIVEYQNTIEMLETIAVDLNENQKHVALNYAMRYHDRIKALKSMDIGVAKGRVLQHRLTNPGHLTQPKPFQASVSKPPKDNILKTIWIFTALKKSIRSGEYLTSRLYIPPDIWVQDGAKLAGLHPKLAVFESVVDTLNQLQMLPVPTSSTASITFQFPLDEAVAKFKEHHNTLSRSFPFLTTSSESKRGYKAKTLPRSNTKASAGGMGKFTTMAAGFGRMVKKQAMTAVERVGAAAPAYISAQELDRYVYVLVELFEVSSFLAFWAHPDSAIRALKLEETSPPAKHQDIGHAIRQNPDLFSQLKKIIHFLKFSVCELVLRDVELLVNRYLSKTAKAFAHQSDLS